MKRSLQGGNNYVGYRRQNFQLDTNTLRQTGLCARRVATFVVGFAAVAFLTLAQEGAGLLGGVADSTGSAIEGAQIECRSPDGMILAKTDASGNFSIAETGKGGSLRISFPGFAAVTLEVKPHTSVQRVRIVLTPAPNIERLQVKATIEDPIPAVPMSEYAIPAEQMEVAGSLAVDDVLREVPGFSTFRRSSSLFANPSSQGVSLRGVGASATSRSSVLLDGIPLNDPFGGWVYFARVPRAELETMEVTNGGASDVFGNGALGGVVNLRTRSAEGEYASGEASYGSMSTPDLSFAVGGPAGKWSLAAAGQALRTGGYILVRPDQRGSVDTDAGTADLAGTLEVSRNLGEQGRFFVRGSGFGESRRNGTPLQKNDTTIPEVDLGLDWTTSHAGSFSARFYGSTELYHQSFSAVPAGRNSETLTDLQRNPSQQIGFVGTWTRLFAEKHKVAGGIEAHDVRGQSEDTNSMLVEAGGRQHAWGFFAQDAFFFAPKWLLTFGGRVDTWNNNTGFQNSQPLTTGTPTAKMFAERSETAFSPRVSLLRSFSHGLALSASVYRAFRAPTLNELYRNFRVGNVLTLANPALTGEHLTGGEAGLSYQTWANRLTLRGNFFWSDIADPVANVTITSTPALITRQKENLGVTRARGVELSGQWQVRPRLQISASYLFVDATVVSYPVQPPATPLDGLRIPQVPQNQFSFQASYLGRRWNASVQGRFSGNQFDDDLNQLPLGRAFSLDAQVSREVLRRTSVFLAVQNLTDDRFNMAATPVFTVGPPIFVRGGVRFRWR
jgi:outer membrane receptor protein involved in Fe transport